MKKKVFLVGAAALVLSFILSSVFSFVLLEHPDERDREFSLMLAGRVNDVVTDEILRPLLVSRTMAHDQMLINWLRSEKTRSQEKNVAEIGQYLSALKDEFGYTAAFLVSEKTRCYYTWRGLNKILNPLNDPHDKWYPTFLKKNEPFELNADTDQVNGDHWTVFVNCLVQDTDGTILGVCGVGVVMDHLQNIMHDYEKQYGVKINLVDSNGLVQMAVESSNIQRMYLNNIKLDGANDSFSVFQNMRSFRISKYLKELGWYLVVQTDGRASHSKMRPLLLLNLIACICLAALFALSLFVLERVRAQKQAIPQTEDELTGLPNREYFSEAYGEEGIFNTTRYKSFIVLNIDHFTAITARLPANPIVRMTADVARRRFDANALIVRWGTDSFVVLSEQDEHMALVMCESFCQLVQSEIGITVSAGVTSIVLTDTIKKNYYRAMQGCYEAKSAGGNTAVAYREKV